MENFNKLKHEAVKVCFCCKEFMCRQCVRDSQDEIEWTILQQLQFEICYPCITTVRRDLALKPRLEQVAKQAVEYVRNQVEAKLYMIKQEQTWAQ